MVNFKYISLCICTLLTMGACSSEGGSETDPLQPSPTTKEKKRLLEKPQNRNVIILLGCIVFLLAVAIGISYYHRHQVSKQKEATMEQYLEGDSANHSGNKVRDVQLWNPY